MTQKDSDHYFKTSRSLPIALLRAREAVMSRFRSHVKEHGFTEQQWRVLRVLAEDGSLDATKIAERCVISTPSMTRILKTLEEDGMIRRKSHPRDKRSSLITITSKALKVIEQGVPGSMAIYAEIESAFGAKRMQQLLGLLDELNKVHIKHATPATRTKKTRS